MSVKTLPISPREFNNFTQTLENLKVAIICDLGLCINRPDCFRAGKVAFTVMGDTCTRNCRYCAVKKGIPKKLDLFEPLKIAQAAKKLHLKYVVVTSVTRDDLPDQGVNHYKKIVRKLKKFNPGSKIELLIPDFWGKEKLLRIIVDCKPYVVNHNIECARTVFKLLRPKGNYDISLQVLRTIKKINPSMKTKSGLMVGVGESFADIKQTIIDLRDNLVDIITVGQYLPPRKYSYPLMKLYQDFEFAKIRNFALKLKCFKMVFVGSKVRSSYYADKLVK